MKGFLCTWCSRETPCTPDDLADLSPSQAAELLAGWLCIECLDQREAEVAELDAEDAELAAPTATTPKAPT